MNVIKFDVYKNTLKKIDGFNPVSSENQYTKLKFRFKEGDDWANCAVITASFFVGIDDIAKSTVELLDNSLSVEFDIPQSLATTVSANGGKVYVGIIGTYTDDAGKIVTCATNIVCININKGVLVQDSAPMNIYEQLIAKFTEYFTENTSLINETSANIADVNSKLFKKVDTDNIIGQFGNTSTDIEKIPTTGAVKDFLSNYYYDISETYSNEEIDTHLADKADKATTLAGYGITDAYTIDEIGNMLKSSQLTETFAIVKGIGKMCYVACNFLKKSIVKITLIAGDGIINKDGNIIIGITDSEGNSVSNVASAKLSTDIDINETSFVLPKDTKSINIWVNGNSASGTGNMTVVVEHLGVLDSILDISTDLTLKADKATTLEGYGITNAYTANDINNMLNSSQLTETFNVFTGISKTCSVACNYLKKSIVKITVTADGSVINPDSDLLIGITDAEENSVSNVASVKLNKETSFVLPENTKSINVWVNSYSAIGTGNMTVVVEHLGILDSITDISDNVLTLSNDVTNLSDDITNLSDDVTNLSDDIESLYKDIEDLKNTFKGKTFSIIGDSYSAFSGWIPEGYNSFYMTDADTSTTNKVTSPTQMWWYILSEELKMSLICNGSWSGTTICTTGYDGVIDTTRSFVSRAKALFGEQKTTSVNPDVIFIFGGTNDKWANSPIGSLKYADWTDNDKKSVLPAFCYLIDYIKFYNPRSIIVNIVNTDLGTEITSDMATACEHYGVINVALTDIDKNSGHPSSIGQAAIATQVIQALKNYSDGDGIADSNSSTYPSGAIYTALEGKADKSTTLAGYGIDDAYSKGEIDTKLSGKLSTANVLNAFDALTTETGKLPTIAAVKKYLSDYYFDANQILDIFAGDTTILEEYDIQNVYCTKTEVDTALTGKADSATTLGGYGITNAYTKTEVDAAIEAISVTSAKCRAPEYWQNEINDTVSKIKALQNSAGNRIVNFALFSDMHYIGNADKINDNYTNNLGTVIGQTMNELDIPLVVCCGDTTSNGVRTSSALIDTDLEKAFEVLSPIGKERILMCKGNHDGAWGLVNGVSYNNIQHPNKLWNRLFRWQGEDYRRVFSEDGSYFYIDNIPQRFRYIVLNSQWADYSEITDSDYSAGTTRYNTQKNIRYGQKQITWLANVALDLPQDWTACVFTHAPLHLEEGADSAVVSGLLNAYINRTSYNGSYSGSLSWESVSISVDYSEAAGYVAANFAGHMHNDIIDTRNKFPIIVINSAGNFTYNTSAAAREKGTANETCADVVSVNTATHTISLTRLGIGNDRQISYSVYTPVVNLFDVAADGYADGQRTNSSGTTSAQNNSFMTNYLPITNGQTLCVQLINSTNVANATLLGGYFYMYDINKTLIGHIGWGTSGNTQPYTVDSDKLFKAVIGTFASGTAMSYANNIAYVRFCVMKNEATGLNEENLVITKE